MHSTVERNKSVNFFFHATLLTLGLLFSFGNGQEIRLQVTNIVIFVMQIYSEGNVRKKCTFVVALFLQANSSQEETKAALHSPRVGVKGQNISSFRQSFKEFS